MCRRKLDCFDREVQLVTVLLPGRCEDGPLEARVLRLGRRERGEVVRPRQQRRGGVQGGAVERLRPPQRPARLERGAHTAPQDPVAVGTRPRREARVEVRRRLFRRDHDDVVR